MSFFLKGIRVPHRKNTENTEAVRMPTPRSVTIPVSMHIGAPARPTVKAGDRVCVGTLIAEGVGAVSSPVYSSVSGKVVRISDMLLSNGITAPAVTIESDGEMTPDPAVCPPEVQNADDLIEAIRKSGVVGLGGAGFPTYVKFRVDPARIEYLVVNGAECEPYITSDSSTMSNRADDMEISLLAMKKYLGIKRIVLGIEKNKPRAIAAMRALASRVGDMEIKVLPSVYPQGGEKVLVYHTLGRVIPAGKLPIDVGCIVCNCTTIAAIGSYLKRGMPLVKKCVTVDGACVREPKNVIVPIGTPISDVFDFCGGLTSSPAKILYGGPMMGITVPDISAPILKNTNALLALSEREARLPKTTACIRCGACTNNCPFGLAPASIMEAYRKKDAKLLEKLQVQVCMECGCCSFRCPANRPLVQTNKLAKAFLKEEQTKENLKNG